MSDDPTLPTPQPSSAPEAPPPSVILDTNAEVKKSRLPLIIGAVVVIALVAFVVWFATRSEEKYKPGPAAQGLVDGLAEQGIDVKLSDASLKCVDDTLKGVDPSVFATVDPLSVGDSTDDPEQNRLMGKMFDDCLSRDTRIALFADGMAQDGTATGEQARCAAETLDDAIVRGGGYESMMSDPESMLGIVFGMFADLEKCGIDMGGGLDGGDVTVDTAAFAQCETDFDTVSAALGEYRSDHDTNAQSWDDLVPDYLADDSLSSSFEISADADGTVTMTGLGACEGYSYSIGA